MERHLHTEPAPDISHLIIDLHQLLGGCQDTGERFLKTLHTNGCIVLETHGVVPYLDQHWDYPKLISSVYKCAAEFFRQTDEVKGRYGVGVNLVNQQGYAILPSYGYEWFETRCVSSPDFKYPPQLETAVPSVHMLFRELSSALLSALATAMGLTKDCWTKLLDNAESMSNLAKSSSTALKVSHYNGQCANVYAGIHADSSLLTLAPRGTRAGLLVKNIVGGKWINIERSIGQSQLLVFAGDVLSRATHGYIPSLLHAPCAPEYDEKADPRISMPYFVRPRPGAMIESCRSKLINGEVDAGPPLQMEDLTRNLNSVRDRWPWKCTSYYIDK